MKRFIFVGVIFASMAVGAFLANNEVFITKTEASYSGKNRMVFEFDERGELIGLDMGRGPMNVKTPTHNLYDNPPPGNLVGTMDLGKVDVYRVNSYTRCYHFRCRIY